MQPIIEAHNIGKKFRIFHKDMPYLSLRDNIVSYIKNPVRLFRHHTEEFWALKDVSFEVMPGESVGIIGKNGAGKSTLLKILSRITPPSTGKIILRGRVASLLEVGTGFHPELTGRENVFFNGAILGMKRSEIKQKFDEIVAFAGVEKFIDTPLKHYSSGMQLRLAFAVAAFLEAEILVVDEVLAVGDAEFQKKCLGKMEDVAKNEGRTVLFVSHNMGTIRSFCKKGLYLEKGNTQGLEPIEKAVNKYLQINEKINKTTLNEEEIHLSNKEAKILAVSILDTKSHQSKNSFTIHDDILIRIRYYVNTSKPVMVSFVLVNESGVKVMVATDASGDFYSNQKHLPGIYETDFVIPKHLLNNTGYFVYPAIDCPVNQINYDFITNAAYFEIIDPADEASLHRGLIKANNPEIAIWPLLKSSTQKIK